MRTAIDYSPINPERLAEKLERVKNFENEQLLAELASEPRLPGALWFLAYVSRGDKYPGGLRRFAADLVADSRDLMGFAAMHEVDEAGGYSTATAEKIVDDLPVHALRSLELYEDEDISDLFQDDDSHNAGKSREGGPPISEQLKDRQSGWLLYSLQEIARAELADYLCNLCERLDVCFTRGGRNYTEGSLAPWYFPRIGEALLRFMDRRAARLAEAHVETEVTRQIARGLYRASRISGRALIIEGDSRFGKTEGIRVQASMYPGRLAIVETKENGGLGGLVGAIAEEMGIGFRPKELGVALANRVERVLRQWRGLVIFEEGQFLYPSAVSSTTTPQRLNWIRRAVLDAGLSCAVVWTKQSHNDARGRFLKATNYAIEQWDGRVLPTLHLPDKISREDMIAIARKHLRGLPDAFAKVIVGSMEGHERNYCSDVSTIAEWAFLNAEEAGRAVPTLDDLEDAIRAMFRGPAGKFAKPKQAPCTADARPAKSRPAGKPAPSRREITPTSERTARFASEPRDDEFDCLEAGNVPLGTAG